MRRNLLIFCVPISLALWIIAAISWTWTRDNRVVGSFHIHNHFVYVSVWGEAIRIDTVDGELASDPSGWQFLSYRNPRDPFGLAGPMNLRRWKPGIAWMTESGMTEVDSGAGESFITANLRGSRGSYSSGGWSSLFPRYSL